MVVVKYSKIISLKEQ